MCNLEKEQVKEIIKTPMTLLFMPVMSGYELLATAAFFWVPRNHKL